MKRILLTIAIAALSALLFACTNKSAPTEPDVSDKERAIIELALFDIRDEVDPDKADDARLYYLYTEEAAWLDWECATYILIVDDRAVCVGTQEKGDEIHFVDVEGELVYASN